MKKTSAEPADELRPEYGSEHFKNAVRGKYFEAYRRGTNVVVLDADVAQAFPSEKAVNDALRRLTAPKNASAKARIRRKSGARRRAP